MAHKIIDFSTEEDKEEYIVGVEFKEKEIELHYADGTELSILNPTKEDLLYYRKKIETEVREVLSKKHKEVDKKRLIIALKILGSSLFTWLGIILTSTLVADNFFKIIISLLLFITNFILIALQAPIMIKETDVKEIIEKYELFFSSQENLEKEFNLHIEDIYEYDNAQIQIETLLLSWREKQREETEELLKLNHTIEQ